MLKCACLLDTDVEIVVCLREYKSAFLSAGSRYFGRHWRTQHLRVGGIVKGQYKKHYSRQPRKSTSVSSSSPSSSPCSHLIRAACYGTTDVCVTQIPVLNWAKWEGLESSLKKTSPSRCAPPPHWTSHSIRKNLSTWLDDGPIPVLDH